MSDAALQLLATFDLLPVTEQHALIAALLRRSRELPGSLLSNEELVGVADDVFQSLDREEADGNTAQSR